MSKIRNQNSKTQKLVILAFLASLVVVLQLLSSFLVKFGFFSFSLVLVPITIGAVLYGVGAGAFLGAVFGIVCLVAGATGLDGGTLAMIQFSFLYTAIIALGKAVLSGTLSALVYKLFSGVFPRNNFPALIISSVFTPIVNTGVFFLGMYFLFFDLLRQWTGSDTFFSMLSALVGINFAVEFILNIILCPVITSALIKNGKIRRIR